MHVERGILGRLPYAAIGAGPPIAVLAGLSPRTGVSGTGFVRSSLGPLAALAATHRVILLNRRPRLPTGMTMADLAAEHAEALRAVGTGPVDVLGVSTGGSIAQQLAAQHPDVVGRLALASTACRLGPAGKEVQARAADLIRAGLPRQAFAVMAAELVPPGRGQRLARLAGSLLGPVLARDRQDLADLATTLEAEDDFDLAGCTAPIRAPTLIVAGDRDRFYPVTLFQETARLIPNAQLSVFPRRGHVTVLSARKCRASLAAFLAPRQPG
ncbi:MAG: alpha/beta hydrolase [Jatrophihabitantaceae bacterium]